MAAEGSDPSSPASAPPPPPKRRKIEPPRRPLHDPEPEESSRLCMHRRILCLTAFATLFVARKRTRSSQATLDKDKSVASSNSSIPGSLPARVDLNKVREAKRFAVLQAQHEGCLGSYKSFDSLFGNYLVPVIPTNDFFEQVGTKP